MPTDIATDLTAVIKEGDEQQSLQKQGFTHKLQVRRIREVNNSSAVMLEAVKKRIPQNWASMHPDDFDGNAISDGKSVVIESDHGRISAILKADTSIRPGVISMTHSWGGLPGEIDQEPGENVNLLISTETHIEPINAMVRMSAIPVRISSV